MEMFPLFDLTFGDFFRGACDPLCFIYLHPLSKSAEETIGERGHGDLQMSRNNPSKIGI